MSNKSWMLTIPGALLICASPAFAVDLREAVQSALQTNPQIRQAVSNRAATEEELQQGRGLYYPRISVEGSAGVRDLRIPRGAASASPTIPCTPSRATSSSIS